MMIKSMNKEIMVYLYIDILYSSEKTKSMNLQKKTKKKQCSSKEARKNNSLCVIPFV